jgi:hypothetical protein
MHVGVFSKFECSGGSEFRCAEMANGISRIPGHRATLLAERKIAAQVRSTISPEVDVIDEAITAARLDAFYSVDTLLVINTDSKDFTRADYWQGRTSRHNCVVDLTRIPGMTFLFNFIVSPARHLPSIQQHVGDVRIVTANEKFFREISEQDRYMAVRHYPRLCLESPIGPEVVSPLKKPSKRLRFGAHSRTVDSKWNAEFCQLVDEINRRHGKSVSWDFMGMSRTVADSLSAHRNVRVRPEFALPVRDFLAEIDVFLYFPSWRREEPWARSVAEALVSGCPVLATHKGGNRDQVIHGNNGLICRSANEFIEGCSTLIENPTIRQAMRRNAMARARRFSSHSVVERFLDFLSW